MPAHTQNYAEWLVSLISRMNQIYSIISSESDQAYLPGHVQNDPKW